MINLFLIACFCWGALPLTYLIVKYLAHLNLTQIGTGNISVAAAFTHGGTLIGIAAALAEIARGILPVLAAKYWFPDTPALPLIGLISLVAGRYLLAKGGGVTNVVWGMFAYSPQAAFATGLTGFCIWKISQLLSPQQPDRARLRGTRWGCLSGIFWVGVWHPAPSELLATIILATLLVIINLRQADDIALYQSRIMLSLNETLDPKIYGEKATRLSQLKKAGFNVPAGWVIGGINPPTIISHSLSQILNSQSPLIVRSSALGEDSDTSSAAGQYLSIGPINHGIELETAIAACRQSYWTETALEYRRQRHLSDTGIAVLIQSFIKSQMAGVMFSRHPLDGKPQVIIEALPGNAKLVVSGQMTPLHLEIARETGNPLEVAGSGGILITNHPNHHIDPVKLANSQSSETIPPVIPDKIISELVSLAEKIETFFHGIPQDIEWSWDGEKIWILQSRPITNLRPIWTRKIAAEVIPGAIHPLTWSINRPLTCGVWGEIFTLALGEKVKNLDFTETATLLGSHAYFNATLLGEIFRMMGLPEQGLEFLVRGQKMGRVPLKNVLPSLPGLWRLIQRELALIQDFERDLEQIFLPALRQLEQVSHLGFQSSETSQNLTNNPLAILEHIEQIQTWLQPITYYNIIGPIGFAIRQKLFQVPDEWLPTESHPEMAAVRHLQHLANQLRQSINLSLDETPSLEQLQQTLQQSSTLQQDFQNWMDAYGYLSEVGTDISVPTWYEQPDTFQNLLFTTAQKKAFNLSESPAKIPQSPSKFWQYWRFKQCQNRAIVKGKISEIYAKLLAHLRWQFLQIEAYGLATNILQQTGDIFYLEFAEIQRWIRNGDTSLISEKIRQRRDQLEQNRQRIVPLVVYGNFLPEIQQESQVDLGANAAILQGIPASVGCVEGYVKVYRNLGAALPDSHTHTDTPIMVVPYTDAGWAPLLVGAKAIIAEVGGQLSHGAIIAREYGIPAVMNIADATTRLRDGQRVRVDGYRGTVELLGEE